MALPATITYEKLLEILASKKNPIAYLRFFPSILKKLDTTTIPNQNI